MKKKILYIAPSAGLGGAETFLKTTLLHTKNHDFCPVYFLFCKGPLYDWLLENKASVHLANKPPRLSNPLDYFSIQKQIANIAQLESIDLIHSTMAYGALFTAPVARWLKLPHVWFQHGPASGWMDQLAATLPHQALLVNSDYTLQTQNKLESQIPFFKNRAEKIKINLGVPTPSISEEQKQEFKYHLLKDKDLQQNPLILGMACRMQKWKGVHLLIEAVRLLDKKIPLQLFLWGAPFASDDYYKELKSSAQGLPVHFLGACQDSRLAFSACDLVINASLQPEPFGLTIIEAMSVGVPCLVPNQGGPQEIISPGETGWFFQAGSATALAQEIEKLSQQKDLLKRAGQNAQQTFAKKFNAEKMIFEIEDIYRKLIPS